MQFVSRDGKQTVDALNELPKGKRDRKWFVQKALCGRKIRKIRNGLGKLEINR